MNENMMKIDIEWKLLFNEKVCIQYECVFIFLLVIFCYVLVVYVFVQCLYFYVGFIFCIMCLYWNILIRIEIDIGQIYI